VRCFSAQATPHSHRLFCPFFNFLILSGGAGWEGSLGAIHPPLSVADLRTQHALATAAGAPTGSPGRFLHSGFIQRRLRFAPPPPTNTAATPRRSDMNAAPARDGPSTLSSTRVQDSPSPLQQRVLSWPRSAYQGLARLTQLQAGARQVSDGHHPVNVDAVGGTRAWRALAPPNTHANAGAAEGSKMVSSGTGVPGGRAALQLGECGSDNDSDSDELVARGASQREDQDADAEDLATSDGERGERRLGGSGDDDALSAAMRRNAQRRPVNTGAGAAEAPAGSADSDAGADADPADIRAHAPAVAFVRASTRLRLREQTIRTLAAASSSSSSSSSSSASPRLKLSPLDPPTSSSSVFSAGGDARKPQALRAATLRKQAASAAPYPGARERTLALRVLDPNVAVSLAHDRQDLPRSHRGPQTHVRAQAAPPSAFRLVSSARSR
jgi:hypothetical protein